MEDFELDCINLRAVGFLNRCDVVLVGELGCGPNLGTDTVSAGCGGPEHRGGIPRRTSNLMKEKNATPVLVSAVYPYFVHLRTEAAFRVEHRIG